MTGHYSTRQLAKLARISPQAVLRLVAAGAVQPTRGDKGELCFDFRDLARIRRLAPLTRKLRGRARAALSALAEGAELTEAEGRVVVVDATGAWDPGTGQAELRFEAAGLADVCCLPADPPSPASALEVGEAMALEQTDPAGAEAIYREVLGRDDEAFVEAAVNLGRLCHERGQANEAADLYAQALQRDPWCATAWFNLGVALEDVDHLESARQAYEQALRTDPAMADAHFNAARVCEQLGDRLAALRHLRGYRALVREPR